MAPGVESDLRAGRVDGAKQCAQILADAFRFRGGFLTARNGLNRPSAASTTSVSA